MCLSLLHRCLLITFFLCRGFKITLTAAFEVERLDVVLTDFTNPDYRTIGGKCCDGVESSGKCTSGCDIYFTINIPHAETNHSQVLFSTSTFTWDIDLLKQQPNPSNLVTIFQPIVWRDIKMTISFYDDDTPSGGTFNVSLGLSQLVAQYTTPLSAFPNQNWTEGSFSDNKTTVKFLYRLICLPDQYGKNCEIFCKPTKYRRCLFDGSTTCQPGYTGVNCRTALCQPACQNHGTCISPGKCSCLRGWKGKFCSQCVPNKECVHGTCKTPGRCNCKPGWTGQHCNALSNYCGHFYPCKNNGLCINTVATNYTCSCVKDFQGKNCEIFSCPSSCNQSNANCTPTNGCSCHQGWTGPDCNKCVKSIGCINGYCLGPHQCICHHGWTGSFCNINTTDQQNCDRYLCQNNGTCQRQENGTIYCECATGYVGKYCEKEQCSFHCEKTRGFCDERSKTCRCHSGWNGSDCGLCVKHRNCMNGFCTKPFECLCNDGWTGQSCNISGKVTTKSSEKPKLLTNNSHKGTNKTFYVVFGITVPLLLCILLVILTWHRYRKKAEFCVTKPEIFTNNNTMKQSYCTRDADFIISTRNNSKQDIVSPSDVVINKMLSVQEFPLQSVAHENKMILKDAVKTLDRTDSGFIEEGIYKPAADGEV